MNKRNIGIDQPNRQWKDVPAQHLKAWQDTFQSSREILKLSGDCPMCGKAELYRWYWAYRPEAGEIDGQRFVATGGLWEWCSACKSFAHYRAAVPDWWACDLEVNTEELTSYPTAIEEAIRKKEERTVREESV